MNPTFTHPGQEQMQAEVILASKAEGCPRITTMRIRAPRIIWAEIMTHRVFSRNARSSRAVPVKTMLEEVRNTPFVPWHWGKNQKGMQGGEECLNIVNLDVWGLTGYEGETEIYGIEKEGFGREEAWLHARDRSVEVAAAMMEAGYHKQIPNRLLEPFSWIDGLITSTDWENFFWLRDHKDAEPHLQDLARLMKQAYDAAEVQELVPGEWHLPYVTEDDWEEGMRHPESFMLKLSAARCARISYKPFDGNASYEKELERYELLVSSDRIHASPTEHQAKPDVECQLPDEGDWADLDNMGIDISLLKWASPHLHGNLTGWIQARKLIAGENHRG